MSFFGYLLIVAVAQFVLGLMVGAFLRRRPDGDALQPHVKPLVAKLQALASTIVDDMGEFRKSLESSSEQLAVIQVDAPGTDVKALTEVVVGIVNRVMEQHALLQAKLELAERRLVEQASQLESYLSEARTDGLTGLPNRRALDEELARRYAQWQRRRSYLSVMMIDVDHFKQLNDTHGHQAGDAVLRELATVLRRTARDMDTVARYGGEEFGVVLPDTELPQAQVAAERVRTAVAGTAFRHQQHQLPITVSVGVAELMVGEDHDGLVERADAAMYSAKRAGRNRSYYHNGRETLPVVQTLAVETSPAKSNGAQSAADEGKASDEASGRKAMPPVSVELAQACDDLRKHAANVTANPSSPA